MVTIRIYGEDECVWCQRVKEGVEIETPDRSFTGFFCFGDLKRMLRLKTARDDGPAGRQIAPEPQPIG